MPLLRVFAQLLVISKTVRLQQIFHSINFFAQELHDTRKLNVAMETVNQVNTNHISSSFSSFSGIVLPKLLAWEVSAFLHGKGLQAKIHFRRKGLHICLKFACKASPLFVFIYIFMYMVCLEGLQTLG